jgi:hypothetical protein
LISVIVCSIDPTKFAAVKAMYTGAMGTEPWELIGIHDARSMAEGYNRGIAASRGETIVLSHDDIQIIGPDFPARLARHLANYDVIGVAGTNKLIGAGWSLAAYPYLFGQVAHSAPDGSITVSIYGAPRQVIEDIQALDGLFMAARRSVFARVSFDPITCDAFHGYDVDFSYGAYRAGLKVAVANDINVLHFSTGKFDDAWMRFAERFVRKWSGSLVCLVPRSFHTAGVRVNTIAEALEVMTPTYWLESR